MRREQRGSIVRMEVEIAYPDGSKRNQVFDKDWLAETGAMLFHELCMNDEQKKMFEAGDDWRNNPTFIKCAVQEDAKGCPYGPI